MKAIAFNEHFGVDKLKYTNFEEPVVDSTFPLADAVAVQTKRSSLEKLYWFQNLKKETLLI